MFTKKTLFFSLLVLLGGLKNLACVQGEDDENALSMQALAAAPPEVPADNGLNMYGMAEALSAVPVPYEEPADASSLVPFPVAVHHQPVPLAFAPEPVFEATCDERSVFDSVLAGEAVFDPFWQSLDLSCLDMTNDELAAVIPLLPEGLKALNLKVNDLKVHGNLPLFQDLLAHCENLEYIGFDCTIFETRNIGGHCTSPDGVALQNFLETRGIQRF